MAKTFHVTVRIEELLNRYMTEDYAPMFLLGGKERPIEETEAILKDRFTRGERFVPVGYECDNFDPKKGCRGHKKLTSQPNCYRRGYGRNDTSAGDY